MVFASPICIQAVQILYTFRCFFINLTQAVMHTYTRAHTHENCIPHLICCIPCGACQRPVAFALLIFVAVVVVVVVVCVVGKLFRNQLKMQIKNLVARFVCSGI